MHSCGNTAIEGRSWPSFWASSASFSRVVVNLSLPAIACDSTASPCANDDRLLSADEELEAGEKEIEASFAGAAELEFDEQVWC